MRYVAIEYKSDKIDKPVKGYLKIPDNFPNRWSNGFMKYLMDKYSVKPQNISFYPLKVSFASETLGDSPKGYTNLEDDFILALRSNKYYPPSPITDAIRRSWSINDPTNLTYAPKERK